MNKGILLIISGPSGVGKGTVCNRLLEMSSDTVCSVSATTRAPRNGETEGISYFFLTKEQFVARKERGEFLEWAEVFGNFYGTPASAVEQQLESGKNVILEIDTQGALQVMSACPGGVSIFILPPSFEELEKRIINRGTESPEVRNRRLFCARGEMELAKHYTYQVVNDTVENAVQEILNIIALEQKKRSSGR